MPEWGGPGPTAVAPPTLVLFCASNICFTKEGECYWGRVWRGPCHGAGLPCVSARLAAMHPGGIGEVGRLLEGPMVPTGLACEIEASIVGKECCGKVPPLRSGSIRAIRRGVQDRRIMRTGFSSGSLCRYARSGPASEGGAL
jgi:hypothetical protein